MKYNGRVRYMKKFKFVDIFIHDKDLFTERILDIY